MVIASGASFCTKYVVVVLTEKIPCHATTLKPVCGGGDGAKWVAADGDAKAGATVALKPLDP